MPDVSDAEMMASPSFPGLADVVFALAVFGAIGVLFWLAAQGVIS
jgi:hypothetical protein